MTGYETARSKMVESQLRPNRLTDERVIDAFLRIRRELFMPEALRGVAYVDDDLPLGGGRYAMTPMVAARLLQALAVGAKDVALVVGAATGYEAALLSLLARSVVALEADAELARIGRSALVDHRIASVSYVESPLPLGYRAKSPYDVILFAGAVSDIPAEISAQLAEGGRMAVVFRQQGNVGRATLVTRAGGTLAPRVMFDAATPPLPGFIAKPAFVF
ncbi:MAG TPA: protein-L-isoaspartate O-methyltransferase [Stellaceae bacterium]|jgi:protein-L-isoaspartate(D-aspartate) O-methyltransferase|nr:protein-L-isoaspartate O-methyltransferase [Stellaceae bacterium]